jgi:hypothetical protein
MRVVLEITNIAPKDEVVARVGSLRSYPSAAEVRRHR